MTSGLWRLVSKNVLRGCLLAGAVALALTVLACSSGSKDAATAPTATATRTPRPTTAATATSAPTSTFTPEPMPTTEPPTVAPTETAVVLEPPPSNPPPADTSGIQLSSGVIGQGETTTVTVQSQYAASATAFCDGRNYPLIAAGASFWGVVAAAGDAVTGAHTISVQLFDAGGGLIEERTAQVSVVDMGFPVENIDLPPEVNNSLDPTLVQQESDARSAVLAQFTPQKLWSGPFIWPVQGVIVSPYGIRRSYNGGPVSSFHGGIDLAANEGVPIAAANSGRVAQVTSGPVRGNAVLIDHGDGVFSGYNHMSVVSVQVGQMVNTGDLVGYVGSTGMATGPHLHWEIVVRGLVVDPVPWTLQAIGP
jgi:murein DD-endopeptidase MepM/ murein hydrolase activator NlpD